MNLLTYFDEYHININLLNIKSSNEWPLKHMHFNLTATSN